MIKPVKALREPDERFQKHGRRFQRIWCSLGQWNSKTCMGSWCISSLAPQCQM